MDASVFRDRERTNILNAWESRIILALCRKIPSWVTPNMLTAVGLLGSFMVLAGLWMALFARIFLLFAIAGLAVQWFGDSLDGRLAYYRNIPRKWYGFSLDILVDWFSVFLIAVGFYLYLPEYKLLAFAYVLGYGALMMVALIRYKLSNTYSIDAFGLGPTEMRIIIAFFLVVEMFRQNTLLQIATIGAIILAVMVLVAIRSVLQLADRMDEAEKNQQIETSHNPQTEEET